MDGFGRVHLVILSHNRLDCLPRLFNELLLPAHAKGIEITVIDNHSDENVRDFLTRMSNTSGISVIFNESNLGVARGRNIGFKRSQRDFIVYLDDDSVMELASLSRVSELFDKNPNAGILAFRVIQGITQDPQNDFGLEEKLVGNFHGAGHAIRRAVFEQIGYLDEACFFGAEELEFSMRTSCIGMHTLYTPDLVVNHYNIERHGPISMQRRLYWAQNYTMVLFRYLPFYWALLFSSRLFVSYIVNLKTKQVVTAFLMPSLMIRGSIRGLFSRKLLSDSLIGFYTDPQTKPDLGNVSLLSKLKQHFYHKPPQVRV